MRNFESGLLQPLSLHFFTNNPSLCVPVHNHFSLYTVSYMNFKSLPAPASYNDIKEINRFCISIRSTSSYC